MKKLYRDHAHFSRLMDILEGELNGMEAAGGTVSPLLTELVSYISDYVDAFHHPVEDQLYQIMLARTDHGMEEMDRLLGDHLVITNMTRELR
ncbi:MAG: hemerythrin domain-containing protein, partial [Acidobacteriota bacterium]